MISSTPDGAYEAIPTQLHIPGTSLETGAAANLDLHPFPTEAGRVHGLTAGAYNKCLTQLL